MYYIRLVVKGYLPGGYPRYRAVNIQTQKNAPFQAATRRFILRRTEKEHLTPPAAALARKHRLKIAD
jgi:hypothetical protein